MAPYWGFGEEAAGEGDTEPAEQPNANWAPSQPVCEAIAIVEDS